ncbi:lipoyl(octanoyl) transferase LipB [Parvularcula sp. LCG005]|uniref:lipoyl(octanoyl) transferase LipB n=1 Tax=Parvularcula sp. LCG005 TaxID=3078805 RepID=UPI00397C84E9
MTDPMIAHARPNWHPDPVDWVVERGPVDYDNAIAAMESHVDAMIRGKADERVWLLEHPPLYTAGTTAKPQDLRDPGRFPVHPTKRGGQYTYHGPGQRVAYVMLDLKKRRQDVRAYVNDLESWIIGTLDTFGVRGEIRPGRVGVWVDRSGPGRVREDKIAAIGVRIRRWVTFHGIALNVEPDLDHFTGITPCGIAEPGLGVTSLVDLGRPITMDDVDNALEDSFNAVFGPIRHHRQD